MVTLDACENGHNQTAHVWLVAGRAGRVPPRETAGAPGYGGTGPATSSPLMLTYPCALGLRQGSLPTGTFSKVQVLCLSQLGWGVPGIRWLRARGASRQPSAPRTPRPTITWPQIPATLRLKPLLCRKRAHRKACAEHVHRHSSHKYREARE